MSGLVRISRLLLTVFVVSVSAAGTWAQTAFFPTVFPQPVLIIDRDEIYSVSALGQAIESLNASERDVLLAESRSIDAAFEAEEQELTELRPTVSPEEFQSISEEFDARVQEARAIQIRKDLEFQQKLESRLTIFYNVALPYLSIIMQKYQAGAVIDKRSVLLFNRNMDITQEAIELLDQAFANDPELINEFK